VARKESLVLEKPLPGVGKTLKGRATSGKDVERRRTASVGRKLETARDLEDSEEGRKLERGAPG